MQSFFNYFNISKFFEFILFKNLNFFSIWFVSLVIYILGVMPIFRDIPGEQLILYLIYWLVFQIIFVCLIPSKFNICLKFFSLFSSVFLFFSSILLYEKLDNSLFNFSSKGDTSFLFKGEINSLSSDVLNVYFTYGIDGISIYFLLLTVFLTPVCIIISWNAIKYREKEFILMLLFVELFVFLVFLVTDLFFFFFSFECVLIPMFFIIRIWGSRQRKLHAVYQFFIYTLFGSIFLFVGILLIYFEVGSTNYEVLLVYNFDLNFQLVVWSLFFLAFAIKVPMFPFHIWLPEAHVEAPTAGSVILAGLLLKLGTYGFIRFLIPMFPDACLYFTPLVHVVCIMGIVYTSLTTIRQIDLKKIIAYSSVGHMNYVILGLFAFNFEGVVGSIFLMLSHGIVSSALFICVGMLYDRYKTRTIFNLRGLVHYMPIFAIFFLFFTLANISFPGTSSFIGEFLILVGIAEVNLVSALIATFSIIFSMVYSFWLYNRIMYGTSTKVMDKIEVFYIYSDLSIREFFILLLLLFVILFTGFYPNIILDPITISTSHYLNMSSYSFFGSVV